MHLNPILAAINFRNIQIKNENKVFLLLRTQSCTSCCCERECLMKDFFKLKIKETLLSERKTFKFLQSNLAQIVHD